MRFETDSATCHSTSGPELLADILPRVVERIVRPSGLIVGPLTVVEGASQPRSLTQRTRYSSCTPARRASEGGRLPTIPLSPICK